MNRAIPEILMECIGWTLVHFVWQGLAIAFLLAVILRGLRNRPPNHRYLAGCAALACMAIAPVITFQIIAGRFAPPPAHTVIETGPTAPAIALSLPSPTNPTDRDIYITRGAATRQHYWRLESYLPWLVVVWLAGVLALSGRLAVGWLQIQRLRRTGSGLTDGDWTARLNLLCERVGIDRSVRLLQSAWVDVPIVIGWLRPVIILPASCLTGLTAVQLESILAHELAHVRRHDYLVNLLQSLLETVLFYHPAVWWVSRRVRAERENCCDDLAVGICGNRLEYARALATLEELRPASAPFAVAAGGAPLLNRIRRLAGKPEVPAGRVSGWVHAGAIALITIVLFAFGSRGNRAAAADTPALKPIAAPALHDPNPMETRTYQLDPNTILFSLYSHRERIQLSTMEFGNIDTLLDKKLRRYIALFDVDLDPDKPANAGKTITFDRRKGRLVACASPAELDALSDALAKLRKLASENDAVPQAEYDLNIQSVEIDGDMGGNSGLDWIFADSGIRYLTNIAFVSGANTFPSPPASTNVSGALVMGVLTPEHFRQVMAGLRNQPGAHTFGKSDFTTESERRVNAQIMTSKSEFEWSTPGGGGGLMGTPTMARVTPGVAEDGHAVNLAILTSVMELAGKKDSAMVTNWTTSGGATVTAVSPLPHLRMRERPLGATMESGETLILADLSTSLLNTIRHHVPLPPTVSSSGPAFRHVTAGPETPSVLVFVTITRINPDGSPVR